MTPYYDLPLVDSPPFAPLSPAQLRFLSLHARHVVTESRWLMGVWLRATTEKGRRAWIWRDELDDLVGKGLMARGVGCADVRVTTAGVGAVMQKDPVG